MTVDGKEPFLARWSRRKLETKEVPSQPAPESGTPAAGVNGVLAAGQGSVEPAAMPELPTLESLDGLKSEYKDFLHPQVDEKLRQGALKKLFADPHFNVMDRLDTYIDDYSIADPIPDSMLRQMIQSKTLALFDHEEKEVSEPDGAAPAVEVAQPALSSTPPQTNSPNPPAGGTNSPDASVPVPKGKSI